MGKRYQICPVEINFKILFLRFWLQNLLSVWKFFDIHCHPRYILYQIFLVHLYHLLISLVFCVFLRCSLYKPPSLLPIKQSVVPIRARGLYTFLSRPWLLLHLHTMCKCLSCIFLQFCLNLNSQICLMKWKQMIQLIISINWWISDIFFVNEMRVKLTFRKVFNTFSGFPFYVQLSFHIDHYIIKFIK